MGTQGNKPSSQKSHAAEDHSISADSLSFAALVSIQDQNPKTLIPNPNHTTHHYQVSKQDLDFEFSTIKEEDFINSADVLISNGQIKPLFHPNHRPAAVITDPAISLRSLLAIDHHGKKTRKYDDEQISVANMRISCSERVKARNHHKSKEIMRSSVTRTWFGHKVFRSFLSPCRKCKAVQPGAINKGQSVP